MQEERPAGRPDQRTWDWNHSMSEQRPSPDDQAGSVQRGSAPGTPISGSQLRRRQLLKGLGKGSAVVVAAAPIKTLAVTQSVTQNGLMCTVSGVGSAAHSTGGSLPQCGGLTPGYYKTPSHWPGYYVSYNKNKAKITYTNPGGGTATIYENFTAAPNGLSSGGPLNNSSTTDTAFNAIFGGGSSAGIFYILLNQAPTAEFHWIAAFLNAVAYASGPWSKPPYVFPYSPAEVLKLYTNNNTNGLSFFKGFMETL